MTLVRKVFAKDRTLGKLYLEGTGYFCDTLEPHCIDWSKEADHMYYDYGEGSAKLRYGHTVTVHYAQDGAFLTLWGYVPGGKEDAEALADLFDFATACAGRPDSAE